jgi:hypothetical protein
MNRNRPDVSDEDIGMRAFQIRKEKATERAMERLRQGLRSTWSMFSASDIADLTWILGELWAYEKRADWEELHFSKLTGVDVQAIVKLARHLKDTVEGGVETLERIGDIIRARSI